MSRGQRCIALGNGNPRQHRNEIDDVLEVLCAARGPLVGFEVGQRGQYARRVVVRGANPEVDVAGVARSAMRGERVACDHQVFKPVRVERGDTLFEVAVQHRR
jgi:hypothetical protein